MSLRGGSRGLRVDDRRSLATEAVSSELPVHLTAKILGHESPARAQTNIALYDQDVSDHHRKVELGTCGCADSTGRHHETPAAAR